MGRLIDAVATEHTFLTSAGYCLDSPGDAETVLQLLRNADTVDPVHAAGAVYCRECQYFFNMQQNGAIRRICLHPEQVSLLDNYDGLYLNMSETDFCSRGRAK